MPKLKVKSQKSSIRPAPFSKVQGRQDKKVKIETKNSKVQTRSSRVNKKAQSQSSAASRKGLTVEVFDIKGKATQKIELPKEIFEAKINPKLMAQAVRVYLANQRVGTASTKTRGEVRGSTRKIYRQKGTGRARHGSLRAPIFVHGGLAHGPKPRDYSLKLSKKMKKAALFSALTSKLKKKEIKVISGLEKIEPKTKLMLEAIKNLNLNDKNKKILLVVPKTKNEWLNATRAARNIKGIAIAEANGLNTFQVLNSRILLVIRESIDSIEKSFLGKN